MTAQLIDNALTRETPGLVVDLANNARQVHGRGVNERVAPTPRWFGRLADIAVRHVGGRAEMNLTFAQEVFTILDEARVNTDDIRIFAEDDDSLELRLRGVNLIRTIRIDGEDRELIVFDKSSNNAEIRGGLTARTAAFILRNAA